MTKDEVQLFADRIGIALQGVDDEISYILREDRNYYRIVYELLKNFDITLRPTAPKKLSFLDAARGETVAWRPHTDEELKQIEDEEGKFSEWLDVMGIIG